MWRISFSLLIFHNTQPHFIPIQQLQINIKSNSGFISNKVLTPTWIKKKSYEILYVIPPRLSQLVPVIFICNKTCIIQIYATLLHP
jgi:hypothetical protein